MKKILVPCDFSKPAINAYRFAIDIAQRSNGTVHVLHVVELPVIHDVVLMPVLNFEQQLFDDLKAKAQSQFEKVSKKYDTGEVKVIFEVQFGAVSRMILDYADQKAIDIIIMGSHGASGMRELFIGSNAQRLVRHSNIPVLVTKDYFKGSIEHIVFPNTLDTENQEELLMKVKALQNFFKAQLHIVWINTPLNFVSDTITIKRLKDFARRFMLKDYTIHVFNHPDEEKGILEFTRLIKGDLIAIGTNSRKGFSQLINGSLSEDLVNHNKGLVWTYSLQAVPVEI